MQLRVYYESLEQALHYLTNDLKIVFPAIEIILVKKCQQSFIKEKGFTKKYSKNLTKILIRKNPDLIITIVKEDIEYPLCVIEFSTAVFTKDHEQQRSDNFQIPIRNNVFYIKVSTTKKDSGNHGGDTNYNYKEPFALCFKKKGKLAFHIEWDVVEENKKFVEKHKEFKSIPHQNKDFIELISIIVKSFIDNDYENYEEKVISLLSKTKTKAHQVFKKWIADLKSVRRFEELKSINSDRTEWFDHFPPPLNKPHVFVLKFNRMGHAMDPERGMLAHYNTFFKEISKKKKVYFVSKLVFNKDSDSWFKDTTDTAEIEIKNELAEIDNLEKEHLVDFFLKGLSVPHSEQLLSILGELDQDIYDISEFVNNNFAFCNSALRTIFENSQSLYLSNGLVNHLRSELFLTWEGIQPDFDYAPLPDVTQISERKTLSEDDVTYITMNEVFKKNKIVPVSVSYPGAQSDTPVLPDKGSGRKQERTYIDSVGFKEGSILLQENKGPFKLKEIKEDISKILRFKENDNFIDAIYRFSAEQKLTVKKIIIGIGFGVSTRMSSQLSECGIDEVDYFLVISKNLDKWCIFCRTEDNIFPTKESMFSYPPTFKVD